MNGDSRSLNKTPGQITEQVPGEVPEQVAGQVLEQVSGLVPGSIPGHSFQNKLFYLCQSCNNDDPGWAFLASNARVLIEPHLYQTDILTTPT